MVELNHAAGRLRGGPVHTGLMRTGRVNTGRVNTGRVNTGRVSTVARGALLAGGAALLALTLTACAPEPSTGAHTGGSGASTASASGATKGSATGADSSTDTDGSDTSSQSTNDADAAVDTDAKGGNGSGWNEQSSEEDLPRETTLPEGFPAASFVMPSNAEVYEAGARDAGSWFVVLRAADAGAATNLWNGVITGSGFTVSDATEDGDGGTIATLSNAGFVVEAMTIGQPNGSVLLSYEITAA